jgi:hypothetical protein
MNGLGGVKMRGKKCKVLNCGCCAAENRRDDSLWREAANEISYVTSGQHERDYWYDLMMRDVDGTYAEEMAAFNIAPVVDEFTIAKYTWGQGMSDPRIRAILAQQHADFMLRVADRWDTLHAEAA